MLAEGEMEADVEEYEELFRLREDEQPGMRAQRIRTGLKRTQTAPVKKFGGDRC